LLTFEHLTQTSLNNGKETFKVIELKSLLKINNLFSGEPSEGHVHMVIEQAVKVLQPMYTKGKVQMDYNPG